jgi:hypothetical protein
VDGGEASARPADGRENGAGASPGSAELAALVRATSPLGAGLEGDSDVAPPCGADAEDGGCGARPDVGACPSVGDTAASGGRGLAVSASTAAASRIAEMSPAFMR